MEQKWQKAELQDERYFISDHDEENQPYLFISYSHKDQKDMAEVKYALEKEKINYWYDNGLHSGDDWNMVIAKRLAKAAACLLILSVHSADSDYVKNELNFALNHRIPIHVLMLEEFVLPIDVEMMIGRIQGILKKDGYERKLIASLPPELISISAGNEREEPDAFHHPLYEAGEIMLERQGTIIFSGRHKVLHYPVLLQQDVVIDSDPDKLIRSSAKASLLTHPLFIKLIDVQVKNSLMWSCIEYKEIVFLDNYLKLNHPDEETIRKWMVTVIDGMDYLLKQGYAVNDFARGSLVVTDDSDIKLIRLHNGYYGIFRLRADNKQYYVEKEIQEIACLLYQLCTGEVPVLPFGFIENSYVSNHFLLKVNYIIQRSVKAQGQASYLSFEEMKHDLNSLKMGVKERAFLHQRKKKLALYRAAAEKNRQRFTAQEPIEEFEFFRPAVNLEEEYGFEATVVMSGPPEEDEKTKIRLLICSSGQIRTFSKDAILLGRGLECDAVFNQPSMSRRHLSISKTDDRTYRVTDLHSTNGFSYGVEHNRIEKGGSVLLPAGSMIQVGGVDLKLL